MNRDWRVERGGGVLGRGGKITITDKKVLRLPEAGMQDTRSSCLQCYGSPTSSVGLTGCDFPIPFNFRD